MKTQGSFTFAKIHGIKFKIHVSLIFLLFYVIVVATAQFPSIVYQSGVDIQDLSLGPIAWASVFAISLLISVALHELGHAIVAQKQGSKVRGITLMMLGGVSEMERLSDQGYSEFKLAIAGPLVSFAIAGFLLFVRPHLEQPDLRFFSYWLGTANLILGIFNLLPAFPLDGGRALRSILAAKQGMVKATQNSVRISKVFAWVFGFLGLLGLNFILLLIAIFIYITADRELFFLLSRGLLRGIKAGDVGVPTEVIDEREPLSRAAERMLKTRNTIFPVKTASQRPAVIGLTTLNKLPKAFWPMTPISRVMTEAVRDVDVNIPIQEILSDLAASPMNVLPLSQDGKIVGIIRYSDISEILQFKSIEISKPEDRQVA